MSHSLLYCAERVLGVLTSLPDHFRLGGKPNGHAVKHGLVFQARHMVKGGCGATRLQRACRTRLPLDAVEPDDVLSRLRRGMMQDNAPTVWRELKNLRHSVGVLTIMSVHPDGEYDGSGRGE